MVGIGCRNQIVVDSGAGHLEVVDALFPKVLFGALVTMVRRGFFDLDGFDLRFDVLAFPASGHVYIVAQSARASIFNRRKLRKRRLCARGAGPG
jgi:hypothetical protein